MANKNAFPNKNYQETRNQCKWHGTCVLIQPGHFIPKGVRCQHATCGLKCYTYTYIYICIYLYTQYYIGDLMSDISESNWLLHASAWQKPVVSAARQCHGGHERKPSNIFRRNMASNGLKCDQWIGLRENLNRKLWFFPWNMGLSGEHFAVKTNPLIWDSTQLPLIDGLPIKNGDFPWLCYITRWPKIWDFTQLH